MNRHWPIIAYTFLAILISWTAWAWVRWPAPKTPSDEAVISALTKQFEKRKQEAFDEGYQEAARQVEEQRAIDHAWAEIEKQGGLLKLQERNPDAFGKVIDPLRQGEYSFPIVRP